MSEEKLNWVVLDCSALGWLQKLFEALDASANVELVNFELLSFEGLCRAVAQTYSYHFHFDVVTLSAFFVAKFT